jgi:hypothetical protein
MFLCTSFLDDLERLTSLKYMPTDGTSPPPFPPSSFNAANQPPDDVLKARLKTVGVSEYKFEMEATAGRDSGTEWRIVDVGGSRSQVGFFSSFVAPSLPFLLSFVTLSFFPHFFPSFDSNNLINFFLSDSVVSPTHSSKSLV